MTEHTITRDDQGDWMVDGKLMAATSADDAREFADQHSKWAERYLKLAEHLDQAAEDVEVERLAQAYWVARTGAIALAMPWDQTSDGVRVATRAGIRAVLAAQKAGGSE